MNAKRTILLFVLLLSSLIAKLQPNYIHFNNLASAQKLSQLSVSVIFQGKDGLIWLGTQDGLNSFDGYKVTTYRNEPNNSSSLSSSEIQAITEDNDGNLWIGTATGGLNFFNPKNQKFVAYRNVPKDAKSINNNDVKSLFYDKANNRIWLGTTTGLEIFDIATKKTDHLKTLNSQLKAKYINYLLPDIENSILWVGTYAGIIKVDLKTKMILKVFDQHKNQPDGLISNSVMALTFAGKDKIMVGTKRGGLDIFDTKNEKFSRCTAYNNEFFDIQIISLYYDKKDVLWIGTYKGLYKLNTRTNVITQYLPNSDDRYSIADSFIWTLMEDYSGNIWIGTNTQGACWFNNNASKFENVKPSEIFNNNLDMNVLLGIMVDENQNIWLANEKKGSVFFDFKNKKFDNYLYKYNDNLIKNVNEVKKSAYLIKADDGNIWEGAGKGLCYINPSQKTIKIYYNINAKGDTVKLNVYSLLLDDKKIWVGTYGKGLYLFDIATKTYESFRSHPIYKHEIDAANIQYIYRDYDNDIWLCTENGLYWYNSKTKHFKCYKNDLKNPNSLSTDNLIAITQDASGKYWIGTMGGGLNRFDKTTGKFKTWRNKEDFENEVLPNDVVYSVIFDKAGYLWMSTNNGISRFDEKNDKFRNYDIVDGLQGMEFNQGAFFKDEKGLIYFGGGNGYNVFDPEKLKDNTIKPRVLISGLKIFNKEVIVNPEICKSRNQQIVLDSEKYYINQPISTLNELVLSYREEIFSFEFAATHYHAPEKNKYKYKLEGLEKDWNYVDASKRHVLYTTLSPGDYSFKVVACNADGYWGDETVLKLTILPPFYKTKKFYFVLFMSLVALVFGIVRYRTQHLKRENARLEKLVKRRTADLELSNKEVLAQKDEIETQKDEIVSQHDQLLHQNLKIMESIKYASKIQKAMLPPEELVSLVIKDYFIFNKPRDVVSGDFFWVKNIEHLIFVAVGDCTGHGVPGAFMSILGTSLLNEIINFEIEDETILELKPSQILEKLTERVKEALHQVGKIEEANDGMDIAICLIDRNKKIITYSGANNEIYFVHNEEFIEYKADNHPVGISISKNTTFTDNIISYHTGDIIYLFSDGYKDQFGGKVGRKYLAKNFKQLLFDIHQLPMKSQEKALSETIVEWQGDFEQLDDIMVMGIRLSEA